MKYYVENADYTQNKPVLYSEKTLIEYAMKLYTEYSEQGQYDWLLEKYPEKNKLSVVSICLNFLNDRFSDDDTPFKECEIYDNDMEDLRVVTSTPMPNCVIITLSNGTQILKSYDKTIAKKYKGKVTLDGNYYNFSSSTGKHRNYFLNEDLKTTEKKIKSGEYKLQGLN